MKRSLLAATSALFLAGTFGIGQVYAFGVPKVPGLGGGGGGTNAITDKAKTKAAKTIFVFLPFNIFNFLLNIWALISRKPAFTSDQLNSLIAGDQFEVIDWPNIFKIKPTKLKNALEITYKDPKFSNIKIPF